MGTRPRNLRAFVLVLCLSFPWLQSSADSKHDKQQAQAKKQDAAASKVPAKKADPKDYVGTETCTTCHEDIHKIFAASRHYANDNQKKVTPDVGQGCESCHGPGREHAESGGD